MLIISHLCGLLGGQVPSEIGEKLSAKLTNGKVPEKDDVIQKLVKMIYETASLKEAERSYKTFTRSALSSSTGL